MLHIDSYGIVPSHPTRVRGLKSFVLSSAAYAPLSHPTRVRGLKLFPVRQFCGVPTVAPYAGAWIEIMVIMIIRTELNGRTLRGCVD